MLRSVALSTNSVAASVEPVIQQQFFTMSPMQGQEQYVASTAGHSVLGETPTTSSMLAALHDSFGNTGLDASGFDSGMTMGFVDPGPVSQDNGSIFGDYSSGNAFDVSSFGPQDLGINSDAASVHSSTSEHSQHSQHNSPETSLVQVSVSAPAPPVKDEAAP